MTPERLQRIKNVLTQRQIDLTVITDQIIKERNLAAIVRTCDAVGIPKLHCVDPEAGYKRYSGTSAGADKWVEVERYKTISEPLSLLKQKGFQVVASHLVEGSVDYRDIDFTKPTALVMGAEYDGVSSEAQQDVDFNITVPMMGMVESFNVSVAAAIILSEAQRQRQNKGQYETQSLAKPEFDRLFFRWAYPKLADYCEERDMPYLELREDGYLVEPKNNLK